MEPPTPNNDIDACWNSIMMSCLENEAEQSNEDPPSLPQDQTSVCNKPAGSSRSRKQNMSSEDHIKRMKLEEICQQVEVETEKVEDSEPPIPVVEKPRKIVTRKKSKSRRRKKKPKSLRVENQEVEEAQNVILSYEQPVEENLFGNIKRGCKLNSNPRCKKSTEENVLPLVGFEEVLLSENSQILDFPTSLPTEELEKNPLDIEDNFNDPIKTEIKIEITDEFESYNQIEQNTDIQDDEKAIISPKFETESYELTSKIEIEDSVIEKLEHPVEPEEITKNNSDEDSKLQEKIKHKIKYTPKNTDNFIRITKYCCKICHTKYLYENEFKKHINEKHKTSAIIESNDIIEQTNKLCLICQQEFKNSYQLKLHYKIEHKYKYFCSICNHIFIEKNDLNKHERNCKFRPLLIESKYNSKFDLFWTRIYPILYLMYENNLIKRSHEKKDLEILCLKLYKNNLKLNNNNNLNEISLFDIGLMYCSLDRKLRHFEIDKIVKIFCKTCLILFDVEVYFKEHLYECYKNKKFSCPFCYKRKHVNCNFAEHLKSHLYSIRIFPNCLKCNFKFCSVFNKNLHGEIC